MHSFMGIIAKPKTNFVFQAMKKDGIISSGRILKPIKTTATKGTFPDRFFSGKQKQAGMVLHSSLLTDDSSSEPVLINKKVEGVVRSILTNKT